MTRGTGATAPIDESAVLAEPAERRAVGRRAYWIDGRTRRFGGRSARLSDKERRVLRELARGYTTEEVGELLHLSPHTVRTHIKNGMRKLEARTRAHAVAIALSEGAIDFSP